MTTTAIAIPLLKSAFDFAAVAHKDQYRKYPDVQVPYMSHIAGVAGARVCPQCGERSLRLLEGCWTCANCTYSRCG